MHSLHPESVTASGMTGGVILLGGLRKRKSKRGRRTLRKKSRKNRSTKRRR
jgi:hypothetical protein